MQKKQPNPQPSKIPPQDKYLNKLRQIRLLEKKGLFDLALHYCHRLKENEPNQYVQTSILEAQLWQRKGNPHKALKNMKCLQRKVPFIQKNHAFYYHFACLLQQEKELQLAQPIFKAMLKNKWSEKRDDMLKRYQWLKHTNHHHDNHLSKNTVKQHA